MSDRIFRASLRATSDVSSRNLPKAIQRNPQRQHRRQQEPTNLYNATVYATLYTQEEPVYETYVTGERKLIHRSAQEPSDRRNRKCGKCNKETTSDCILPCNCKICLRCVKNEMFMMYVMDGQIRRKRFFIGCTKHGVDKKLQPIERVHRVTYGLDRNQDVLVCTSCGDLLKGKVQELICGHFSCGFCRYCKICRELSKSKREIDISEDDFKELIAKGSNPGSENFNIELKQNPTTCYVHRYRRCIMVPCERLVCRGCIDDIAETTAFSTGVDDNRALTYHCICPCSQYRTEPHIVPIYLLQNAVSQLTYLTECDGYFRCSHCYEKAIARVLDCGHGFCLGCIRQALERKRKGNIKIHKQRLFTVCVAYHCNIAIPCDEIDHYIKRYSPKQETEQRTNIKVRMTVEAHNGTTASTPFERHSTSPTTTPDQRSFQNEKMTSDIIITETNEAQANTESDSKQLDVAMDLDELPQAQNVHKSNTDIMACKTKSTKTLSERSVKKQIRYNTSPTTSPDQTSFELEDMARDRDTVTAKTNQNQNQSKSESEPTPAMDVNETESSEERNCLKNYPCVTGLHCDLEFTCKQQVFVTFRECSHGLCLDCLEDRLKQNRSSTTMMCRCGTPRCTTEIPVDQLNHYLQKYAHVDRGNTKGNADKKSSEHRSPTPSTGHLSSFQDQREILGIPNIGFTCYASCILQVLGQTPDFKEFCHQNVKDHVGTLLKELLKNVTVGAEGRSTIDWFLMQKLMHKIFEIDRSFRRFEENDCHSFILTLLNVLRKEDSQNEIDKDEVLHNASPDNKTGVEHHFRPKAGPDGKRMETQRKGDFCPAVLFESRLVSKFKYNPCEHEETYDDQLFRSILVPVPNDLVTLKDGVNLFFKGEDFPDNLLPCRLCNVSSKKTVTTRFLQIAKAPKILMLQLARFEEVQTTGSYKELRKTSQQVLFERNLTLEHCTDGEKLQYELYGVVMHTGSMLGGHYTSCVRKQETNRWFYCSDSAVREIDEELIFQEWTLRNAYILFYSRKM